MSAWFLAKAVTRNAREMPCDRDLELPIKTEKQPPQNAMKVPNTPDVLELQLSCA